MKAVILAAGNGTRMGEMTQDISKVMLPVNGKPILQWQIEHLHEFGISDIYINTSYKAKSITDYFGNGKKLSVSIAYSQEKDLLGTAGALLPLQNLLTDRFVLLFGDVLNTIDFRKAEEFHKSKKATITILTHTTTHPKDSNLVEIDKSGKVKKIYYKPHIVLPKTETSLAAIFIIEPSALKYLPPKTPNDFDRDFLPKVIDETKNVFCYNTKEFILDIGTPDRYKQVYDNFSNTSSH